MRAVGITDYAHQMELDFALEADIYDSDDADWVINWLSNYFNVSVPTIIYGRSTSRLYGKYHSRTITLYPLGMNAMTLLHEFAHYLKDIKRSLNGKPHDSTFQHFHHEVLDSVPKLFSAGG